MVFTQNARYTAYIYIYISDLPEPPDTPNIQGVYTKCQIHCLYIYISDLPEPPNTPNIQGVYTKVISFHKLISKRIPVQMYSCFESIFIERSKLDF